MIEIKKLSKNFGKTKVLADVDLTINDGSIFGLVGINGAGKSTLLRLLSGVLRPDKGEILYDGQPVYENVNIKKDIFFLPDDPYYSLYVTGNQLVELYSQFYNFDKSVFDDHLNKFKLDASKPIRNFSKGMKRQLFICLALACQPKYLFLDEAFDGLDPLARLEFKRDIIGLQEKKITVIIASHSLRELEDICDSFAMLDNNTVLSHGKLENALSETFKLQLVFERDIDREGLPFECISFEKSGRVIRVVARGDKEKIISAVKELNPLVLDEIPMDFEELFINEVQSKGYIK